MPKRAYGAAGRRAPTLKSADTHHLYPRFFLTNPLKTKARAKIYPTGPETGLYCLSSRFMGGAHKDPARSVKRGAVSESGGGD